MAAAPDAGDVAALQAATHLDPFAVLGLHRCGPRNGRPSQWALRVLLPGAQAVQAVLAGGTAQPLPRLPGTDLFCITLSADEPPGYHLAVTWADGTPAELEDPYRFAPLLTDVDLWLLAEGTHRRPYERLGAHAVQHQGVAGVRFVLWAPQARRVSVVGDFNGWDGRRHFMRRRPEAGLWEAFVPGLAAGALYKYELLDAHGQLALRADPFAFAAELRPGTASRVWPLPPKAAPHPGRAAANALQAPIAIYEVHAGSWRRPGDGRRWLGWRELADTLVPYARDLGFTHLELLPVHEHPFDGSWGYQPTGLYAPTARHGSPDDLRAFVDAAHAAGLGVLLDWVPGHFPSDAFALARFDGSHLYEHADPREGYHPDWNTLIYNFGRVEVRNFLAGNALHWLEHYGVDGLRVDAVASMLYRDYSRRAGEWVPNRHGGRENLEAVAFLRATNHLVGTERPGAIMVAEESTAWPAVTQPPTPDLSGGGLGFHYKWNMGWMNDTLAYFAREPVHRRWHHDQLRFGLMYAWSEHYVLPLSHDEVVHGKRSLLGKMPGDEWQRFANLRALYGWMWGHPGKKLLFMGGELAQPQEWNADAELAWPLLAQPLHAGVQRLVRDLNHVLRHFAALHAWDSRPEGFAWVRHTDAEHSTLAFTRHAPDGGVLLVTANFTPMPRIGWRIGVPRGGRWREVINTDATVYGGSGVGTGLADAQATACDGHAHSLLVDLPPLAVVMWVPAE